MKSIYEFLVKGKIDKNDKTFQVYRYPMFNNYYVKVNSAEDINILCDGKVPANKIKSATDYLENDDYKRGTFIRLAENIDGTAELQYMYCFDEADFKHYEYIDDIKAEDFTIEYWKKNKWSTNK